ncbi:alpha/beta fold hydrolase [Streptomyces fagopyri]|uniref:alpha/beta fold hydrolase n=1 Tax=Streptomyces fagopyri TaxID=2662397 RepID=UPI003715451A
MSSPPSASSLFSLPPGARRATLATERGEFAALEAVPAGEARGTVLLLPGYTGSKDEFIPLLRPMLEAGYRAVAVDGRGQDETPGPDDERAYAPEALVADVLAQARTLATPLHLLGHSMGGHVARAAVLTDQRPFRSLTLMSSGPAEVGEARRMQLKLLIDVLATMTMRQVWEAMQKLKPAAAAAVTGTDAELLRQRWLRNNPTQLRVAGARLLTEPDRTDELAALTRMPVHLLYGNRDDAWAPDLLAETARRLGAHETVVADAEHSPNLQQPQATAAALIAFWESLWR